MKNAQPTISTPGKKSAPLTKSLVVHAADEPKQGLTACGAHQRYRFPRLQIEERPLEPLPRQWIRIQVSHVGICGTDFHLLKADEDGYTRCSCPAHIPATGRVLGHEAVGRICELGKDVDHFNVGDWVCFESISTCKSCENCRRGLFNQCKFSQLWGMEQDGFFTQFANVPAGLAHLVNDLAQTSSGREGLACVEPAAVSHLACTNARITPGDRVAIFGAGPIGLYAALMAKTLFGASEVTVSEPIKFRREFVMRACDRAMHPDAFLSDGRPYDVLIDAAGDVSDVSATIPRLRANGRVILLSRTGQPLHTDAVDHIISNSIHIIGSRGHLGGSMDTVLLLARAGRLDLRASVTQVTEGLRGLETALNNPGACQSENCKIVVRLAENGTEDL